MNDSLSVRFVGGPMDGSVFHFGQDIIEPLKQMKRLPNYLMVGGSELNEQHNYTLLGFADEDGNPIYHYAGKEE